MTYRISSNKHPGCAFENLKFYVGGGGGGGRTLFKCVVYFKIAETGCT